MQRIDLNADIGEGMPYDNELVNYISSCNIACGGHSGDDQSILRTINLARKNNVKIGAHPSYPDKLNFGRKSIEISIDNLIARINSQLSNFKALCHKANAKWHHIKFHGALYNDLKSDYEKALALVSLIKEKYPNIILYVPPNSAIKTIAQKETCIRTEGFADRAYNEDLSLVSRSISGAVLSKPENVIKQIENIVFHKRVKTINGTYQSIDIETLCLHGDTPNAVRLAKSIFDFLHNNDVLLQ